LSHFYVALNRRKAATFWQIRYNCRMATISARVEKSGRILIPAAVRRSLNLHEGSEVLLHIDETGIQIGTRTQALERVQARLRKYISPKRRLSEELIKERRAEARKEL
jgi:AbrB family looped-hinge helix DNA binding protein